MADSCLLYTSDAADELTRVDLGGRRIIKKTFFQAEDGIRDVVLSRGLGDVYKRQLQWYGHVSRSSGLVKAILQGTVKGGRRQGRQRKRWQDSIREWTGFEFGSSQRAVENKEKWRKLAAKSSLVPQ